MYDSLTGNAARLAALRWFETNIPPGGAAGLLGRVQDGNFFFDGILYFLLFDPTAPPPTDPRPSLPFTFFSAGIGRLLARTDWGPGATWFTYALGWNSIDHQNADGNQIEFYRRGEWLTKQRTGYDLDYGASDNHNTLALENSPPEHNQPGDYRRMLWLRGSQWLYVAAGDPQLVQSSHPGFVYALGDATNLYNSTSENSTDILHASRSVMWLKPDHIVVYDRAESATAGRFKRFWLNLPAQAVVTGNQATMTTGTSQRLFVTTLLPENAAISSPLAPAEASAPPANQETMQFRLLVEAPGGPASVRFLHVLQGADAGAGADPVTLVQSTGGTPFVGVVVRNAVTLFPVRLSTPFTGLTYSVPAGTTVHRITGLTPNARYDVMTQTVGGLTQVTISQGTGVQADGAGVLVQGTPPKTYTVPPCRVLDTRFASPPGPIAGAAARDVRVVGSLASSAQGGAADCGVPSGTTGVFVNVVAVGAAGPGHLTAYPASSALPLASTINFSTGDTIANGVLIPVCVPFASCAADLTIQMGPAAAHVVIDVSGYIAP